jgi:hypothetical protein
MWVQEDSITAQDLYPENSRFKAARDFKHPLHNHGDIQVL